MQGGCIMLLFQNYVAEITLCIGPSMLPTFNFAGDLLVVEHVSQMLGRPVKLGDVVACVSPTDPQRFLCKRILGLPGDTVAVDPVKWKQSHVTIPPGHIWLEGDNLNNSTDSRHYGPVSLGLLRGRILCKIWPDLEWVKNGLEEGPQVATSAAPVELQGFRS
ncbi:peptidase S24/S26A/S26B/S26C [Phlyctochytrium arcticum]|nr:peptidase S24/S26A/S26B/S26C [Phlyctochytrium arcticum]